MLQKSVSTLPGIGPQTQKKLEKLKIRTINDLLSHFPRHYQDYSKLETISSLKEGIPTTIKVKVIGFSNQYKSRHLSIQRVVVGDQTGKLSVTWFNQPFLENTLKPDTLLYLSATPTSFRGQIQLSAPDYEIIQPEKETLHTKRIVPTYPQTSGLNSKWFRKTIHLTLHANLDIKDFLPSSLLKKYSLSAQTDALRNIHQPPSQEKLKDAQKRLGLNEIFFVQLSSYFKSQSWNKKTPHYQLTTNPKTKKNIKDFLSSLSFTITPSQKKSWQELKKDITSKTQVTNRLLQGDVGSGKTLVALLGCLFTALNQRFALVLVPTNILANQHYKTFKKLLKKLNIPVYLLTAQEKDFLKEKDPLPGIIISTQAAFHSPKLQKKEIAFLVIDEQHRFGVKQRSFLNQKDSLPHTLTMTATPIPRTMHLAFLNWLDISSLFPIPQNKRKTKSRLVPEEKRIPFYHWLDKNILEKKQQVLVICPLIDQQTKKQEDISVRSVKEEFENLKKVFPKKRIEIIHGKTKKEDQQMILEKMAQSQLDILVATSVIEVGIDLPNTTAIIIENAELFGLAQLHQLRGRVGRRGQSSFCFLFSKSRKQRLLDFLENEDGLKLSQKDLLLRGPGLVFDTAQHGFPEFKIAHPYDTGLINLARKIIKDLEKENKLQKIRNLLLKNTFNYDQLAPN